MTTKVSGDSDAQLVERTLAGDRGAFAKIVKRYQSLVCSITYNGKKRVKSLRWQIEQEPGVAEKTGTPLTVRSRFVVVLGIYVASFSWLIFLAVRAHDQLSAAVIAGLMAILFAWHILKARKRTGAASLQGSTGHVALAWATILVILNLRLQLWLCHFVGFRSRRISPAAARVGRAIGPLFLVLVVGVAAALSRSQRPLAALRKR